MHVLSGNLITILDSLFKLEEEISDKLCLCINTREEERCQTMQCANCVLLGNYYYDSEDYPLLVIKTSQSLKGSANEL